MTQYVSFDSNAELIGHTAVAIVSHTEAYELGATLHQHGLDNIDPHGWYPVQRVLDILMGLAERADGSADFFDLGITAAELEIKQLPAHLQSASVERLLMAYPSIYQKRHRGDVGEVRVEMVNPTHFVATLRVPYPDDLFNGILYAYTRHACGSDHHFSVRYDPRVPRRDVGGNETIIHINID